MSNGRRRQGASGRENRTNCQRFLDDEIFQEKTMPHINTESLKQFLQGDDVLLADLAVLFVQGLPDCKARLRFSVRSNNAEMLRDVTHQLASRLGYFQAEGLREQVKQLEGRGMNNQIADAGTLVEDVINGLDELVMELRHLTHLPLQIPEDD
jgi:HPt (histidine-containing phosphotransfer) domain-containing protein